MELAKLHEHGLRDREAALAAALHGLALVARRRRMGMSEPTLEADLMYRVARLQRRQRPGAKRTVAWGPTTGYA